MIIKKIFCFANLFQFITMRNIQKNKHSPINKKCRRSKSPIRLCQTNERDNISIALELVQSQRKQCAQLREKNQMLSSEIAERNQCIDILEDKIKEMESLREKNEKRYKKLKGKYKSLKKNEQNQNILKVASEINLKEKDKNICLEEKGLEGFDKISRITHNGNLQKDLRSQLDEKNRIIELITEQIQKYEENSMNFMNKIGFLEQKMEELAMENSLLRGVVREREETYQTEEIKPEESHINLFYSRPVSHLIDNSMGSIL